ncbi:MAG: DUF302 domain-containing protein [Deltaproteobacteria bacterium]|nr:DUF302 domain-containing protein [Deltaproteobacteria bacterium]
MEYSINKILDISFDHAMVKVADELKKEGFSIVGDIDIQEILKKKLDIDFRRYKILGACNPQFAYKALQADSRIGIMLPCNVAVQETEQGYIEVSAIDPLASIHAIENPAILDIAAQIQERLKKVIENL